MVYTCVHRLTTVHTVLALCDSPHHPPKAVSQATHHPRANALPHSYPTARPPGIAPNTQLCPSQPHTSGDWPAHLSHQQWAEPQIWLGSSPAPPELQIREQSQPRHRYQHTTTHSHSRPKGRGRKRRVWRTEEKSKTMPPRSGPVPHQHGWGSLGATWDKQKKDDILQVTQGTHPTQQAVDTEGELPCTFSADAAREQQGNQHQRMITSKC